MHTNGTNRFLHSHKTPGKQRLLNLPTDETYRPDLVWLTGQSQNISTHCSPSFLTFLEYTLHTHCCRVKCCPKDCPGPGALTRAPRPNLFPPFSMQTPFPHSTAFSRHALGLVPKSPSLLPPFIVYSSRACSCILSGNICRCSFFFLCLFLSSNLRPTRLWMERRAHCLNDHWSATCASETITVKQ